jgi:hypothetical protein
LIVPIRKRPDGTWLKTHYDCDRFMNMDFSAFCLHALAMDGPGCIEAVISVEDLLYRLPWTLAVDWHLGYSVLAAAPRQQQSHLPPRPDRKLRPIAGQVTSPGRSHVRDGKLWIWPDAHTPVYEQLGGLDVTYGDLTLDTLAVEVERREREAAIGELPA